MAPGSISRAGAAGKVFSSGEGSLPASPTPAAAGACKISAPCKIYLNLGAVGIKEQQQEGGGGGRGSGSPCGNHPDALLTACAEAAAGAAARGGEGLGQRDPGGASHRATRWVTSSSRLAWGSTWRRPWSMSSISRTCWGSWAAPATYSHVPSSCGERGAAR